MFSLLENDTWELTTLPVDRIAITGRWVFKVKRNTENKVVKYKARCVVQFQMTHLLDDLSVQVHTLSPILSFPGSRTRTIRRGFLLDAFQARRHGDILIVTNYYASFFNKFSDKFRFNLLPVADEIAALILDVDSGRPGSRDLVLAYRHPTRHELKHIHPTHHSYMPLGHSLFFPCQLSFYRHWLYFRNEHPSLLHYGGLLFGQFVVDVEACAEQTRLSWIYNNQ